MATLEERLQRLEDLEEIRRLLEEYARCLDSGDHAAYAELFTEDGELHAQLGRAKGRQAITDGVLDREPMFDRITPGGVEWNDGRQLEADVILWATGFRASIDHLAPLHLRTSGGGIRMNGTRVVAEPRLHLVGYGPSASTVGANRAGRAAVQEVRRLLQS